MIDTHCHIYSSEFKNDFKTVVETAKKVGVETIYMPAIDSETHFEMFRVAKEFSGFCLPMIGLHPCSVKANFEEEIAIVKILLQNEKVYGIGETGIDLYWDKSTFEIQKQALKIQIELAIDHNLPIILHTRNANRETIDIISEYKESGLRGIFHCFSGTLDEANEMIELGFKLGIGGVITYKNSGLDLIVKEIDLSHLVLETDAPYLAPVPKRGKRNEPSYLSFIANKIAEAKSISVEEVFINTNQNARQVFS